MLPKLFVTGDFVLSLVFNLPRPPHVEVIVTSKAMPSIDEIKARLIIPSDCAVSVRLEPPSFMFNVDYWMLLPELGLATLDLAYPISHELKVTNLSSQEGALRYLALATSFPWTSIDASGLAAALSSAKLLKQQDPTIADLYALKFSGVQADQLISRAEELSDNYQHNTEVTRP